MVHEPTAAFDAKFVIDLTFPVRHKIAVSRIVLEAHLGAARDRPDVSLAVESGRRAIRSGIEDKHGDNDELSRRLSFGSIRCSACVYRITVHSTPTSEF